MRVNELVNFLEVKEIAPFHFFSELSGSEYAYCRHITDEELNDYKNKNWSSEKDYNDCKLGVYLANVTVDELYKFQNTRNPVEVGIILNKISYIFKVNLTEQSLIYATYVILHEVGHWVNFKNSKNTSLQYTLWDSKHRRDVMILGNEIAKLPDNSYKKLILAKKHTEMYKNIPSEKMADEYAFSNIKAKLELVKNIYN